MTAPNLLNITTVTGKTLAYNVTTIASTMVLNDVDSNNCIRINSLFVANIGVQIATFSVSFVRAGVIIKIAQSVSCDPGSSIVVIGKDTSVYLEEGDSLTIQGSTNGALNAVISYDVIA
jgi:hypothetical protein